MKRSSSPSVACVDVPDLPLQVLLRTHPGWKQDPVVVVEDDRPLARILYANRAAREVRVRRGMKFGQARALASRLRAAVVPPEEIGATLEEIFTLLLDFTPSVEPSSRNTGLFWIDPRGVALLFTSTERWALSIHRRLLEHELTTSVIAGHKRAHVLAAARVRTGARVFSDPVDERALAHRVPLERLDVSPGLVEEMALLGIHTAGDFAALPSRDLRVRYGEEAAALHAFFNTDDWLPIQPKLHVEPLEAELDIDPPDENLHRILFGVKDALHRAVLCLENRGEAIAGLRMLLGLEDGSSHPICIETAAPTLDTAQIADLVRLRFSETKLPAPVRSVQLRFQSARAEHTTRDLIGTARRRDPAAAARAIARIKAAFGARSATRAVLRSAHLPEAKFRFEPISEIGAPRTVAPESLPLVRAVLERPAPLPPIPAHEPEAWLGDFGPVEQMHGPYRVSGGWWVRRVERDYFFVETKRGHILWVFFDRRRRQWFLQGEVD